MTDMLTAMYEVGVNDGEKKSNLDVRIDKNKRAFAHRIIREAVENNGYRWLNCTIHVMHYPERGRGLIKGGECLSMRAYG